MSSEDPGFVAPGSFPPAQSAPSSDPGPASSPQQASPPSAPAAPATAAPGPPQQPAVGFPGSGSYPLPPSGPYAMPSHPAGGPQGPPIPPGAPIPGMYPPQLRPPQQRSSGLGVGIVIVCIVLALIAGLVGGFVGGTLSTSSGRALPPPPESAAKPDELTGVTDVADTVLPSVVFIETPQSTGSGFVVRADGYLLTNHHVVAGDRDNISVTFADGTKEPAELVGAASSYDIAVLEVDRDDLEPLDLADSEDVTVGEQVVAIGAPLGLEGTVTTGIVSAMNRPVTAGDMVETAFINAIQTDAPINPGNSGGPLVNMSGDVVGIASAIAQVPGASGSIGLGFAIPSNQVRRTTEQLIESGKATYPIVGVLLDNRYEGEGVQVLTDDSEDEPITPGGPAEEAGIEPGDIIIAIDGRPVTDPDELIVAIRSRAPGDEVDLTIRPGGGDEEREVTLVLDETESE